METKLHSILFYVLKILIISLEVQDRDEYELQVGFQESGRTEGI